MLRTLGKCTAAVIIFLIAAVVITFASINSPNGSIREEKTSSENINIYTLSDYKGRIALYKQGYAMPVEIYDIYVDSLPEEEQEKVESGIEAKTDAEILKIIEAYTS